MTKVRNEKLDWIMKARDSSKAPRQSKKHVEYWAQKKFWTTKEAAFLILSLYEEDLEDYPSAKYAFEDMEHEIARAITDGDIKAAKKDSRFGDMLRPVDVIQWAANQEDMFLPIPFWNLLKTKKSKRGRPSPMKQVLKEAQRRLSSGEICKKWKDECYYLEQFSKTLQDGPVIFDTIKNNYKKRTHDLNVAKSNKNKALL